MLGKKGVATVVALFAVMVFLTGQARLALDNMVSSFREEFREMHYMPRGTPLKIMACGFDTPLADALFIKGMIYYPQALKHSQQTRAEVNYYTYELFDVITDLSPRFSRAYQVGGIFLTSTSSLENNLQGIKLLEKGVAAFDALEAQEAVVQQDPRSLFHGMIAAVYDATIQARLRVAGDVVGASEARLAAARHFRLAAASPGALPGIIDAAVTYESAMAGRGDIEQTTLTSLAVYRELYDQAEARGDEDMAKNLFQRMEKAQAELEAIHNTRMLQSLLDETGKAYLRDKGSAPEDVEALVAAGYMRAPIDEYPMDSENVKDRMLALPDGTFKSELLAAKEVDEHLALLVDWIIAFRKANNRLPESLQELVDTEIVDQLPEPPLAALGQIYYYNQNDGFPTVRLRSSPLLHGR